MKGRWVGVEWEGIGGGVDSLVGEYKKEGIRRRCWNERNK